MGATGCGKSKLSVDLATSCGVEAEIINSDKMQVYKGLDIATNKITIPERKGGSTSRSPSSATTSAGGWTRWWRPG
ncbi:unnamed protein product [Linum tenue]|uniref:Uncharacterized protein n=1 Tax=Linum tenue TaxID=586396 RepID=A0AAV0R5X1_9ROSI|nr:unnamed protein product [Linum tenue]CAI0553110.1 unnamed protein product [Linum tenue]